MRTISALILLLTAHYAYPQPAVKGRLDSFINPPALKGRLDSFINPPALKGRLDSFINVQPANKPGFVLSIEKHGNILYRNAAGLADTSTTHPLDTSTNFRMASVTKQFTAMAILLLEKDGLLNVDDPIGRWLPQLPQHIGQTVLIRHLLTHSSGILDYENLIPGSQKTQLLDADVLRLLSTHDSTLFPAGSRFRYSNSGFCLLALIVEKAAHTTYSEYIQQHIFSPLHMDSSTVYNPGTFIPRRAMGYPEDQSITSATKGDGGVYTSISDYAKWTRALQQNQLIRLPAAIQRLRLPITGNPGTERPEAVRSQEQTSAYYAAGWFQQLGPPMLLFHSGSTCGFSNNIVQFPADELTIVFFSNLADNHKAFETIARICKTTNFADFTTVFQLHDLTR
jgi:CubicO group peptidase (beta-lactamase class C family)